MTIRERNGKWEIRVYVGTEVVNGKRKQKMETFTFAGTKRQAEAEERRLKVAYAEGKLSPRAPKRTVADVLDKWVEIRKPSPIDRGHVENRIKPHLGHLPLDKLTTEVIDDWLVMMEARGGEDGAALSGAYVARILTPLRSALSLAVRHKHIAVNPVRDTTKPKVRKTKKVVPPVADIEKLIAAAKPEFAFYLRLAFHTGCRRGELVALRRSDIVDGALTVEKAISKVDGGWVIGDTKTGYGRRIALSSGIIQHLDEHYWRQEAEVAKWDVPLDDDPYLFSPDPECGTPYYPDTMGNRFNALRKKTKVKGQLKNFRHASITALVAAGVPTAAVAERAGNDEKVLRASYLEYMPVVDQASADHLDTLLA